MNTAPSSPSVFHRSFNFLLVAHFLQALGYSSMLLLPVFLASLKASRAEIGMIMATTSITGILVRPFVGWALDTIGRKPTLAAGTVILTLGMFPIMWIENINWMIYAIRLLIGVGTGVLFAGYFTFASDIIPSARRTEGVAIFGISGLIPLLVNPFVGSLNVAPNDLKYIFPCIALLILFSLVPLFQVQGPTKSKDETPITLRDVLKELTSIPLWSIWLATICFATVISIIMSFSTITADARGISSPQYFWLYYTLGAALIRLFGGKLPDRVGPHRLVIPSFIVFIISAFLIGSMQTTWHCYLSGFFAGIGHGICFPIIISQLITKVKSTMRGSSMAMMTGIWEVTSLCLTPLFGYIADLYSDQTMFLVLAAFAGVGGMAWILLEKALPKEIS